MGLVVSGIMNVHYGADKLAWKKGGLNIESAVQFAPSIFLGSAAAGSELVCHPLGDIR